MIFSIGHSTHGFDEFVALLRAHGIVQLADVRTVPRSRRVPHFNAEAAGSAFRRNSVEYVSMPLLGGLRKPRPDSVNTGWHLEGFRGYADYMQTTEFWEAVAELEELARAAPTAFMCAEALWWKCHRRLISDALLVRGWSVAHVLADATTEPYVLTPFAVVSGERITYPAAQGALDV